jgi:dihydrofolate synthase/folylpolyglutamate synthase
MGYLQTVNYLESFVNFEKIPSWPYRKSLKLKRFKCFLKTLGDPQKDFKCVHVCGTKGKGSVCAFIAYILKEAGYNAGLYTSPHLVDFRERIRILGHPKLKDRGADFEGMISKSDLMKHVAYLRPRIQSFHQTSKYGPLTFFEVYTAIAFLYFKEKKPDFVILETGMGGRLDATNSCVSGICAITPISLEHTKFLGNTIKKIASEKAAIVKAQAFVVSAPQNKTAALVIKERCQKQGAKLYRIISAKQKIISQPTDKKNINCRYKKNTRFDVVSAFGTYKDLKTGLIGAHQAINASLAIGVVEGLKLSGAKISAEAVRNGLLFARWPARCEVAAKNPYVLLDGAQNPASCAVLKKAVKDNFEYRNLILVFGACSDKAVKGMSDVFRRFAKTVILTRSDNPRAMDPAVLSSCFSDGNIFVTQNARQANKLARSFAGSKDLILVCGSLFLAGEFRKMYIN